MVLAPKEDLTAKPNEHFDTLVQALGTTGPRRLILQGLGSSVLGIAASKLLADEADAKKKRQRQGRRGGGSDSGSASSVRVTIIGRDGDGDEVTCVNPDDQSLMQCRTTGGRAVACCLRTEGGRRTTLCASGPEGSSAVAICATWGATPVPESISPG